MGLDPNAALPPRPNPPSALNRPLTETEVAAGKAFEAGLADEGSLDTRPSDWHRVPVLAADDGDVAPEPAVQATPTESRAAATAAAPSRSGTSRSSSARSRTRRR